MRQRIIVLGSLTGVLGLEVARLISQRGADVIIVGENNQIAELDLKTSSLTFNAPAMEIRNYIPDATAVKDCFVRYNKKGRPVQDNTPFYNKFARAKHERR